LLVIKTSPRLVEDWSYAHDYLLELGKFIFPYAR